MVCAVGVIQDVVFLRTEVDEDGDGVGKTPLLEVLHDAQYNRVEVLVEADLLGDVRTELVTSGAAPGPSPRPDGKVRVVAEHGPLVAPHLTEK